jgi:hypothetical protein
MAKRKKIDRIDMRRLRREAEDHEREFESGITSRREALDCLRDLAATWKWMKTSFDTQAEAHAHFWARVHRSFDLLRFPDTDRVRILSQTEGLPEALWRAQYRPKPIATLDEVEAIESASEVMRRMKRSGFKRRDTGGGFEAWEKDLSAGWFLRITAGEDRLFGDPDNQLWMVGLWDRDRGWVWDYAADDGGVPVALVDFDPEVIGVGPLDLEDAIAQGERLAQGLAAQVSRELDQGGRGPHPGLPRATRKPDDTY